MPNAQQYWRQVRQVQSNFPGGPNDPIAIMSIDNVDKGTKAGNLCYCSKEIAARRIVERTHREATAEEIERHSRQQAENDKRIAISEAKRMPRTALMVSAEQAAALGAGETPRPRKSA